MACLSEHPICVSPSPGNALGCRAVNHSLAREPPSTHHVCPLRPLRSHLSLNSSFPESCRSKIDSLLCSEMMPDQCISPLHLNSVDISRKTIRRPHTPFWLEPACSLLREAGTRTQTAHATISASSRIAGSPDVYARLPCSPCPPGRLCPGTGFLNGHKVTANVN